jgi:hypothetical protein
MSAEEKAKELVNNFKLNVLDYEGSGLNTYKAKQCALIAVDEILNSPKDGYVHFQDVIKYWQEVKSEIEKL